MRGRCKKMRATVPWRRGGAQRGLDPYGFRRAARALGWDCRVLLIAERFGQRLRGMMGRDARAAVRSGLVMGFPRCSAVHTIGMACALDIAFLDAAGGVLSVYEGVAPGRFVRCADACAVMERVSGTEPFGYWALGGIVC